MGQGSWEEPRRPHPSRPPDKTTNNNRRRLQKAICHLEKLSQIVDRVSSFVPVTIRKKVLRGLSDSGNNMKDNAMSLSMFKSLGYSMRDLERSGRPTFAGTAAKNGKLEIVGRFRKEITFQMGQLNVKFKTKPYVLDGLSHDFNISREFMCRAGIIEDHPSQALRYHQAVIPLGKKTEEKLTEICRCYVDEALTLREGEIGTITVNAPGVKGTSTSKGTINPDQTFFLKTGCLPAALPFSVESEVQGKFDVPIFNASNTTLTVAKGVRYGEFMPLTMHELNAIADSNNNEMEPKNDEKKRQILQAFQLDENPQLETEEKRRLVLDLLMEYYSVFSWGGEFGRTTLVEHAIRLKPGAVPVASRSRPVPPHLEPGLYKCLLKWWDHDLIEECESEWNSPIVIANKKVPPGQPPEKRYCIDTRPLNRCTRRDEYYIGNINDNLARLGGAALFSTLDSIGAYHSVPLRKEDWHKTAFSTPYGTFCFKVLPFGLTNGPACYSRLMRLVLAGVSKKKALPFLDDVLVHSPDNFHEHLSNLRDVLKAHQKAGLKLRPAKCQLFQKRVEYLGHMVSQEGIEPVRSLTENIRNWPMPTNRTETRTLLGKLSYYRHFVENFARKAAPLLDVLRQDGTKDNESLKITPEFKKAANLLKQSVANAPIMGHPDFVSKEMFIVDTDWSQGNRAIGGVLSQKQAGKERAITYGSKRLTKSQAKYSPFQGELCAVLHFLKLWKYYLLGRRFKLRVDNTGLMGIDKLEPPDAMTARWLQTLAHFDFQVEHRGSKSHGNADHLSRAPHAEPADGSTEDVEEECEEGVHVLGSLPQRDRLRHWRRRLGPQVDQNIQAILPAGERWTDDDWIERQESDAVLAKVKTVVLSGEEPSREMIRAACPDTQRYLNQFKDLRVDERGILCYRRTVMREDGKEKKHQVYVVPKVWQHEAMSKCHEAAGHTRDEDVIRRAQQFIHFHGMYAIAKQVREECPDCQTKAGQPAPQRHTLKSVLTGYPFQSLSIDFVGPLPLSRKHNNRYLLTILCRFSKYLEAYPCKRNDGDTVLENLENYISHFSVPESIHSDQGSHFTTHPVQWAAQELGIHWSLTPAYHPQSNPVERYHRTLGNMLKAACKGDQASWEQQLPTCLFQLRTMKSSATGFTPYRMVFNREASLPLQMLYGVPKPTDTTFANHKEYLAAMAERMATVHQYARENLKAAVERQRKLYYEKYQQFHVGDKVWLFTPTRPPKVPSKLYSRYWTGPWTISKLINDVVVKLEPHGTWFTRRAQVVSVDRIKIYREQEVDRQGNQLNLPPPVDVDLQMRGNEAAESLPFPDEDSDDDNEEVPVPPPQPQAEGVIIEPEQAIPEEPAALAPRKAGKRKAERLREEAEQHFGNLPQRRLRRHEDMP